MPSVEYGLARVGDARAIADIYAPYVRDTIVSFETEVPDATEIAARMGRIEKQYPWLTASTDGRLVGYAYACENRSRAAYRWSVDAAVYLDASAQRRGIGSALYRRLFALLRMQGYVSAFAGISLPNPASIGLHEAMGFALIGVHRNVGYKLGAWRDVGWWQRGLCDPPRAPTEPIAIGALEPAVVEAILAGRGTAM
jgi:L-amino acid N-acyltransferase YncA